MAYTPINLGDIYAQAAGIKAAQQRGQLGALQLQEAQKAQADQAGIDQALVANPNASLSDLVKAGGGMAGVQASTTVGQARSQDTQFQALQQLHKLQQTKYLTDLVASDPSTMPQVADQLGQLGVQGHPDGWQHLPPQQIQANAKQASSALDAQIQAIQEQLVPPDKQYEARQKVAEDHYKQEGPGGELARKQMEIDAANKREQYIQGQQNQRDLKPVLNPDGTATYLPASQAAGKTPYNNSTASAGSVSDQAKEFAYQKFKSTGEMPQSGRGGAAMQAMYANYFAQRAAQDGDSGASIAARGQAFKAQQGVLKDYTSGKTAATLNGINTAVAHMDALDPLIDKLDNTSSPLFNKAANYFKQQTGQTAPTNFAALKEFVAGEVAKAVLPGGGGEGERQALSAPLAAANSPAQLKQAVQTIKTALAGKTEALRNQWDIGTNGTQGDFDKFLLPSTKRALGVGDSQGPPQGNGVVQTATGPNGQKLYLRNGQWVSQ